MAADDAFARLHDPFVTIELRKGVTCERHETLAALLDSLLARKGARKLTLSDGLLAWGDGADEVRAVVVVNLRDQKDGPVVDSLRVAVADADAAALIAALRAHRAAQRAA